MFSSTLLLFLSTILTPALACDWLSNYRDLRNRTVVLIQTVGGPLPDPDPKVQFPYSMYKQVYSRGVQAQLWFIRENLQHIHDLHIRSNCSSSRWSQQRMVEFMQSIKRQIQELSRCLKEPDVPSENRNLGKRLRKYYHKLCKLQSLQSSGTVGSHQPGSDPGSVGCELLRKVTLMHLNKIDYLRNHAYQQAGITGPNH